MEDRSKSVNEDSVVCCFCLGKMRMSEAAAIVVEPPGARDEPQGLWAHPTCLMERVHRSVPMHPTLWREWESQTRTDDPTG